MSRASAAVRFPDGTIKFTLYNGTCDQPVWGLFETVDEAWDAWQSDEDEKLYPPQVGDVEEVVFFTQYGGGFWFRTTATRNTLTVGITQEMELSPDFTTDGEPDWAAALRPRECDSRACGSIRCETYGCQYDRERVARL